MRVRVQVTASQPLDLFVVHLKSRFNSHEDPNSSTWRLAEATAVRHLVDQVLRDDPEAWVAVLGDMNDAPDSATLSALRLEGADDALPLADLHADLEPSERITYLRAPYQSTIDYILASPALAARLVPGSARVLSDPALVDGSDHAPVYATFSLE